MPQVLVLSQASTSDKKVLATVYEAKALTQATTCLVEKASACGVCTCCESQVHQMVTQAAPGQKATNIVRIHCVYTAKSFP